MDDSFCRNEVRLTGIADAEPVYSHESRGMHFFLLPLRIERLSGFEDRLNVILREELTPLLPPLSSPLSIVGELRSFNNRSGEGSRLVITVFAREITVPDGTEWENSVELAGTICKTPTYRRTPMGREICDIMLAVNRHYGRSDYLPCIAWGQNAEAAARLQVSDRIAVSGRIQSREYIKVTDAGSFRRTAFEVSASSLYRIDQSLE